MKAVDLKKKGYNCCESIIESVNEKKNTNIPICIGTPFGVGMGVGSTCGAITGAIISMGYLKGRSNPSEKNAVSKEVREVLKEVKEKYGTLNCRELKSKGITCEEVIDYVDNILDKYI
ncbi:C-GCAxxG-C-C family protein [Haloimpatiens sp. FM7330]|uniref:C-GCAxxG-C-C family protein n=1 Tax=Haloimpatiens sp. FM7330 TaxID=3298610 RepID=UPI00363C7809